jgi:hypothetical protein
MLHSLKKISKKISGGTQNLFLAVWWYAVEKRLGTPGYWFGSALFRLLIS